jgi:hypothetical protein
LRLPVGPAGPRSGKKARSADASATPSMVEVGRLVWG